jgi:hypothetical protein
VLSALRDARRKAMNELFRGLGELLREVSREIPAGRREYTLFWVYLLRVRGADEYAAADKSLLDPVQEETMQTIAEMLEEKGRQEGRREGQQMLLGMLTQRFGELPEEVGRRVMAADAEALKRWSLRLLSARSVDEVFEP